MNEEKICHRCNRSLTKEGRFKKNFKKFERGEWCEYFFDEPEDKERDSEPLSELPHQPASQRVSNRKN